MKSYNVGRFGIFTIILLSMMVVVTFIALSIPQNIYAQSTTNNDSTISTLDDLVNKLVTGVKLENIITVPNEVHVGDTFEVNATVINTLPLNITFIAGNCNSDFSTNLNNIVEEMMTPKCMNRVLPTVLEPGDKVTVQENSGTGKQYKAVAEGEANGNAILLYSIEVKPEGSLLTTSLNSQVVKPFSVTILQ
jgi:Tfp pilus assembly protein PilX